MELKELRKQSAQDLSEQLVELRREQFNLRMQQGSGQQKQTHHFKRVKRGGQIWIRVFPDIPVTAKPLEVRMGSGKGNVEFWVAVVQPGRMLYEIEGVDETTAREAFRLAAAKLSVQTQFVNRTVL